MLNLFILFSFILSSCATSYHIMVPAMLEYSKVDTINELRYGYAYNILREFRNKGFAEKELQSGVKLVTFEFENASSRKIELDYDLQYLQGDKLLSPMNPSDAYKSLCLNPKVYLPILIFSVVNIYWVEKSGVGSGSRESFNFIPVGIILAPLATLYTTSMVRNSNIALAKDFDKYTSYTSLAPGEKKYVLICFRDIGEQPIHIRIRGEK